MKKIQAFRKPVVSADDGSLGEIERALQAFRSVTGMEVCLKLLQRNGPGTDMEVIAGRHRLHRSSFCTGVKRTQNERCMDCDLRAVPARCAQERTVFSHVCHAGAGEVIVPLFVNEALVAVAYVGQFRTGEDQPAELPLISAERLAETESLARLLAAYLVEQLRRPRFVSQSSRGFRSESIRLFLEKNLRDNPSLPELAKHLGLSTTRTAHAVREATGSSFVELRDALRMERARDHLRGTYYKVSHIATECGFSTPQYFHRFFRGKEGRTPLAFRKKHRTEV